MKERILYYLNLDLADYFPELSLRINLFLLVITAGLCVGCLLANLYNGALSSLLRKLLRVGAIGPEQGRTLAELKENRLLSRRLLAAGRGRIGCYIGRVGEARQTYEDYLAQKEAAKQARRRPKNEETPAPRDPDRSEAIDFASARFYLREESREEAVRFYEKDNSSLLRAILACVLLVAAWIALSLFMPSLLALIRTVTG